MEIGAADFSEHTGTDTACRPFTARRICSHAASPQFGPAFPSLALRSKEYILRRICSAPDAASPFFEAVFPSLQWRSKELRSTPCEGPAPHRIGRSPHLSEQVCCAVNARQQRIARSVWYGLRPIFIRSGSFALCASGNRRIIFLWIYGDSPIKGQSPGGFLILHS